MHFLVKIVTLMHFSCVIQIKFVTLQSIKNYIKVTSIMSERKQRVSAPPIMEELRLEELLEKAGMKSLQELADRMGIERASLSRSLNGSPTYAMLYNIAEALGVNVPDLFVQKKPQHTIFGVVAVDDKSYIIRGYDDIQKVVEVVEKVTIM